MDVADGENFCRRALLGTVNNGSYDNTTSTAKCTSHKDTMYRLYHKYMQGSLEIWRSEPIPEHLFNLNMWKEWLVQIDHQKFSNDSTVEKFASTMINIFTNEELPYLDEARKILGNDQAFQLDALLEKHEEDEDVQKLHALANASLTGDINLQYSDDNCIWVQGRKMSPLKLSNSNCASPKRVRERSISPNLLFANRLSSENDQHTSTSANGILSRKRNKRSSNSYLPTTNIAKKKQSFKRSNASLSPPLSIKIVRVTSLNDRLEPSSSGCQDENLKASNFMSEVVNIERSCQVEKSEYTCNEDLVIENPTPPCSPFTVGLAVENETLKPENQSDGLGTIESPRISSTINSDVHQRESCISTPQRLKTPESKTKGTRKRITIRARSNEPLTPTVTNKIIDDGIGLPDMDPPVEQDKENYPVTVDEIAVKYPKPLSGPPLTLEMFEVLKDALDKPAKEKVVSGFSLYILQEDLALFNNETEWLNDRNIDFYLELIRERSTQDGYPNVYIFHSFFYTLLTDKDGGYDAIQETTGEDDLFSYDIAFFPVNLNQHWRLVAVKFKEEPSIKCYDSMKHENDEVLKNIGKYLRKEYHRKHRSNIKPSLYGPLTEEESMSPVEPYSSNGESIPTREFFSSWNVENVPSDTIPQQKNAIDCGIFVLQFAEYLSREQEFDFDQTNIPYFRQRMMYETLTKQLLPLCGTDGKVNNG